MTEEEIQLFFEKKNFETINVTIPYKQTAIPYLDSVSDIARRIGAVNTIVNRDGKFYGYNTDYYGMKALIERVGLNLQNKKVLVFGTGGTSKTARVVAADMGASAIFTVNRRKTEEYMRKQKEVSTIKKILALAVALIALLCNIVGCSGNGGTHNVFQGVVRFSEESDRLVVYIPKYGEVEIPESDECVSPFDQYTPDDIEDSSYQLKPGDLVAIYFRLEKSWDEHGVAIMETSPAKFDRKAERIEVLRENIVFEKNDSGYVLTFPTTNEIDSAKVGDTLYFVRRGGENGKAFAQLYASGEISDKTDDLITVILTITEGETEFLDYYTRMTVELTWGD